MLRSIRTPSPKVAMAAAAVALAPAAALGAGDDMEVTMGGGAAMQASEVVGQEVMLDGERIGQVADLIGREGTYNDVVIRLDEEHSQMGIVLGAEGTMAGDERPVIVGGYTVAVPLESLTQAEGGESLTLSQDAVTALDQFRTTGGQDFMTYTQGQTAELPEYDQ